MPANSLAAETPVMAADDISLARTPLKWLRRKLTGNGSERRRAGQAALNAFAIRVASAGIAYLTQVLLAR